MNCNVRNRLKYYLPRDLGKTYCGRRKMQKKMGIKNLILVALEGSVLK